MNAIQLDQFVRDECLRRINFFNGRLLSAEDLTVEQSANRAQSRHLGTALGAGISYGLEVARIEPSPGSKTNELQVQVMAGLALNRLGEALHLRCEHIVTLIPAEKKGLKADCIFSDCEAVPATGGLSADGLYILTIAPATAREELAQVSGLGNAAAACNSRYFSEGVQFRLVPLPIPSTLQPKLDPAHARNGVAYHCFGATDDTLLWALSNPFDVTVDKYGLIDKAEPSVLTPSDVPLAVIQFAKSGIEFMDMWSVRRRLVQRHASREWHPFESDDRLARAEASFLQFEEQIASILKSGGNHASSVADDRFHFLPGGGLLPISGNRFSVAAFFKNFTIEKITGDLAFLRELIHDSFYADPISLAAKSPLLIYEFASDFVFFTRSEKIAPVTEPPPPIEVPEHDPAKGQIVVSVLLPSKQKYFSGLIDDVWAEDIVTTAKFIGRQTQAGANPFSGKGLELNLEEETNTGKTGNPFEEMAFDEEKKRGMVVRFIIKDLPEGHYLVKVVSKKYNTASKHVQLSAGRRKRVLIQLTQKAPKGFNEGVVTEREEIKTAEDYRDRQGRKYKKFKVIEKMTRKKPSWDKGNVDPPPPEVYAFENRLQEILNEQPQTPVTPTVVGITMNPDHSFDSVSESPYAYVVTSDGGYLPLIMVPSELALPSTTPLAAGNVPELSTPDSSLRLERAGLDSLDVVASAYGSLVAEALGQPTTDAVGVVKDAQASVGDARKNYAYYRGLSPVAAGKLRAAGYDNDVKLANATSAELEKIDKTLFSSGYSQRLLSQARSVVPGSAWDLEKSDLGLKPEAIATLRAEGIETVGALAEVRDSATLRNRLGISSSDLTATISSAQLRFAAGQEQIVPEKSLISLGRVDKETALQLTGHGIPSIRALANADVQMVAHVLHVPEEEASALVSSATISLLTAHSNLSESAALRLVTKADAPTLGAVLEHALEAPSSGTAPRVDRATHSRLNALSRLTILNR